MLPDPFGELVRELTIMQFSAADAEVLDRIATTRGTVREWSPTQTAECPIEDTLRGGYCESDEQLRQRLRGAVK